jgi:O-antigen/teichoic acid export membrane protein
MPKLTVRSIIARAARSMIASSTAIMVAGMGLRLLLQMFSFLVVSRSMGAAEFGAFVSVVALVGIIAAFSGWGADQLILRTVARTPSAFAQAWGSGLAFLGISAPPFALAALVIVPLFVNTSISYALIFYVVIADIIFSRINFIGAACYQALDRPIGTVWLNIGFSGCRLAAALLWVGVAGTYDARSWAPYYCAASGIYALASLLQVRRDLGRPTWDVAWHEWRDGFHFALQTASFVTFGNIDKPVVALLSNLSTAGIYAAAFRIVEAAVVPVRALMFSTLARFYRLGAAGAHESLKLAVRMLPIGLAMALIGGFSVVLIAPIAPTLLGHSYVGTSRVMVTLAALPVLYTLYYLAADVLVSSRHAGLRALLQCLMPVVNIALCGLLVPHYGAFGAAIASLLSYTFMVGAAWILAVIVSSRARRAMISQTDL